MKKLASAGLVALLAAGAAWAAPLLVDHRHTDITQLGQARIERAKAALHIAYGHTSHGSQLTDGMAGLVDFANGGGLGLALPHDIFAWNDGGGGGALDLHDYAMCNDVGYYPDWVQCTTNYLDDPAHADVNVIIWSWCGQMSWKYSGGTLTNEYLAPMAELEARYPSVTFVYMTGHVDIWDDANNKAACDAIRGWCAVSNRVLYDFNDIEHHDPDGTYYEFVNDDCSLHSGPGGAVTGNWATAWQAAHTEGADWYNCGSAHSEPLNANRKAYAAWALWCALGADRDRDGLGDAWEERHGGLARFGGGTNDCDADGIVDLDEFILDTSPTNTTARFELAAPAAAGTAAVAFPSSTGRVYTLKVCHDLEVGTWGAVTNRPGTGGVMELADENPWTGLNAYSVGVALPP